jgi:hypothetical protein
VKPREPDRQKREPAENPFLGESLRWGLIFLIVALACAAYALMARSAKAQSKGGRESAYQQLLETVRPLDIRDGQVVKPPVETPVEPTTETPVETPRKRLKR